MPKISKIETQKKRRGRFNIFVDGKFEVGVSEKDLIDSGISKDQEIEEEDLKKLKLKSTETKVKDKALKFLSIRPRSILELQKKLEEKKYNPKIIRKVIRWLKKEGFLDDKKFARIWVLNRKNFHPEGKFKLFMELKKKQVPEKIIQKEVDKIKTKGEIKEAKELALRRIKLYSNLEKYKKREKIIAFLQRRGYSWDVIKEAIEKISL